MPQLLPADHIFWSLPKTILRQPEGDTQADIVIIGGGMAGLSAAQHFKEKGCSVIVVEKTFCGAGASGKSSGFITPDSEFSLSSFIKRFGKDRAHAIWELGISGVNSIRDNIEAYSLICDYQKQDTLVVATSEKALNDEIELEYEARNELGYQSKLYSKETLSFALGSQGYYGGISYPDTFGINGYLYLQGLKEVLASQGVRIYEETPALSLGHEEVITPSGKIKAKYIVVCADRWIPDFNRLVHDIWHVQTFLLVSAPLAEHEVRAIFPGEKMMVWDTDLIYQYYRITGDNRLLLGGSTIWQTYAYKPSHDNERMYKKLGTYFKEKFNFEPNFEYQWPGFIGVSKDILPIAGRDKEDSSIYYIGAAAGLPWAAALGRYSADALIEGRSEFDEIFSPYRSFPIGGPVQKILGNRLSFALSHLSSLQSF